MSRQDYTSEHGPGWIDVEKAWDHLEHTFNLRVDVRVQRHTFKGNVRRTLVVTELIGKDKNGADVVRTASRCWWDRREFKTVTAVLYYQALTCDAWLTRREEDAAGQATLL